MEGTKSERMGNLRLNAWPARFLPASVFRAGLQVSLWEWQFAGPLAPGGGIQTDP